MKLNDKQTIKQAQKETEKKEMKIEGLKRDVVIWQQKYNKHSIIEKIIYNKFSLIGKIIANIILFLIKNIIKIVPLIILLFPNIFNDSIICKLIDIINKQVDWKCITPICICVCFIFWCNKYFQNKSQNQIDKQ